MHPTSTEDARNGAGQSQMCRVLETPNTLCNRNLSFLLLGFLANFPEYFPEKRVMRNGFFFAPRPAPFDGSDVSDLQLETCRRPVGPIRDNPPCRAMPFRDTVRQDYY